ncbi:uncharacterized protein METZ01_LOCUS341946, partial [marine metagenome]
VFGDLFKIQLGLAGTNVYSKIFFIHVFVFTRQLSDRF